MANSRQNSRQELQIGQNSCRTCVRFLPFLYSTSVTLCCIIDTILVPPHLCLLHFGVSEFSAVFPLFLVLCVDSLLFPICIHPYPIPFVPATLCICTASIPIPFTIPPHPFIYLPLSYRFLPISFGLLPYSFGLLSHPTAFLPSTFASLPHPLRTIGLIARAILLLTVVTCTHSKHWCSLCGSGTHTT